MRIAWPVVLDGSQQETLRQWGISRSFPARQVERADVVVLAAAGRTDREIALVLRISNQKAARWRKRFLSLGLDGLTKDAPRPGRKPAIAARLRAEVDCKTTQSKPPNATHWSTRTKHLAEKLEDILGLYLNSLEHAALMCVDEKSQIQALDRTQPGLPMKRVAAGL